MAEYSPREPKHWLAEIDLAQKREKDWREECKKLWDQYESAKERQQRYNILWSNTEVLCASLYNSAPQPDVRRRFADPDPVAKEVAELQSRSLAFGIEDETFEDSIPNMVLDLALTGRGVLRVKYEPIMDTADNLAFEQATLEQVQWDEFHHGCGKVWSQVSWVGFDHNLTKEEMKRAFPDADLDRVTMGDVDDKDLPKDPELRDSYRTAKVREVWDRDSKTVYFLNDSYRDDFLKVTPDPWKLPGFFPCPKPARLIRNSRSLLPIPHYRLYKTQAEELERISARINAIVDACRFRGLKDPRLSEMDTLFTAADNQFPSIENVSLIAELGGLDKAIWTAPIEKIVAVLRELYVAFNAQLQHIYQISGLADVMRGQTDPNETLGAQKLKSMWGSLRLQQSQREVQRMIRDGMRLQSAIICSRFQPATIQAITGMQPTEQALTLMKSPEMRQFRVDIETDSTIAETLATDMKDMSDMLNGLVGWFQGAIPAVQAGMIAPDAVKQVALGVVRRGKFGSVVEDAIDGIGPGGMSQQMQPQLGPDGQPLPPPLSDGEEFQMNQIQKALVDLQTTMQQFQQERQMAGAQAQQTAGEVQNVAQTTMQQVQQAVQSVLGDVQARMAALEQMVAESTRRSAEVTQQAVDGTANVIGTIGQIREERSDELAAILANLTTAIDRLNAPRELSIVRGPGGLVQGGVSTPVSLQ